MKRYILQFALLIIVIGAQAQNPDDTVLSVEEPILSTNEIPDNFMSIENGVITFNTQVESVKIIDIQGRNVLFSLKENVLDFYNLPKGHMILYVKSKGKIYTKQFYKL